MSLSKLWPLSPPLLAVSHLLPCCGMPRTPLQPALCKAAEDDEVNSSPKPQRGLYYLEALDHPFKPKSWYHEIGTMLLRRQLAVETAAQANARRDADVADLSQQVATLTASMEELSKAVTAALPNIRHGPHMHQLVSRVLPHSSYAMYLFLDDSG